jgi:hypothetical protein
MGSDNRPPWVVEVGEDDRFAKSSVNVTLHALAGMVLRHDDDLTIFVAASLESIPQLDWCIPLKRAYEK